MNTDPNRPDGPDERLVRIETRLCTYQAANTLQLQEITELLQECRNELIDLSVAIRGDSDAT